MSVFHPLESQNPYPQAVTLTVDLQANPEGSSWEIQARFNPQEQWLSLLAGQIKILLRGGKLQLRADGGRLTVNQDLSENVRCLQQTTTASQFQIRFPLPLDPLALSFGNFSPNTETSHLQAIFQVTPPDLAIAESQGLWPPDLSPNQLAIADRLIAQFLVNDWFPPALSWGQWASDSAIPWQPLFVQPDAETLRQKETQLGDRLQLLAHASTSDLLALARLVGLDPQRDFAGGKFVGANLSGIDLSNAHLAGSNFRGADLSGAYLESANLTQVDFRKSSLALANLIGADLTRANLQGTALNSANFSAANLSQTQLGDNPGITPEQQTALIDNGAKLMPASDAEMLS